MKITFMGTPDFAVASLQALLEAGHEVVGVDCFIDYYPRAIKERNLEPLRDHNSFTFFEDIN